MSITLGDRGDAVADVQVRLLSLGYDLGTTGVDGIFAARTMKALEAFQAACRLPRTGEVDSRTWRALVSATYSLGDRLLYLRTPFFYGKDVRDLQERLASLGFHFGDIDAFFGPETDASLRDFQHSYGLVPDAILGPLTLQALESLDRIVRRGSRSRWPDSAKRASSILALEGRVIGINCAARPAERWLSGENPEIFSADLAYRLASFVELFGGLVAADPEATELSESARACFAFQEIARPRRRTVISISYPEGDGNAGALAVAVEQKIRSLSPELLIETSSFSPSASQTSVPFVAISCSAGSASDQADPQTMDITRQRVACAIFDGLKLFLEASYESP